MTGQHISGYSSELFVVAILCHQDERIDVAFEYSANGQISVPNDPQQIAEMAGASGFSTHTQSAVGHRQYRR